MADTSLDYVVKILGIVTPLLAIAVVIYKSGKASAALERAKSVEEDHAKTMYRVTQLEGKLKGARQEATNNIAKCREILEGAIAVLKTQHKSLDDKVSQVEQTAHQTELKLNEARTAAAVISERIRSLERIEEAISNQIADRSTQAEAISTLKQSVENLQIRIQQHGVTLGEHEASLGRSLRHPSSSQLRSHGDQP